MIGKTRLSRLVLGAVVVAACVLELAAVPAQAQYRRYAPGGFFQDLFGPPGGYYRRNEPQPRYEQPTEHYPSRAPSPHKANKDVTPTTSVVVIGDGMADWLASGLEDAFADEPEVGIDRQTKYNSGLLRYDTKGDLDWWHVARDILTKQKANYVVMMIGLSDRETIRERDLAKEAEKQKAETPPGDNKQGDDKAAQDKSQADKAAAPEPKPKKGGGGPIEFHTEQWAAVYSRRIDETIAALKSKGVPVFWVGLPSIRGSKSTADAVYLNELYRARAERAGVVYIDVWDGFVDDAGKYSNFGPDYEGQTRRLRSGDGVYFTKFGARKLAHYVEREIRRYMSNRVPVALPSGPIAVPQQQGAAKGPAARPLAGPVVPLTVTTNNADQLLGGAGARPLYGDANATDVLVKGEPITAPRGRADDFQWQSGESSGAASAPTPGAAAAPAGAPAVRQVEPPAGSAPAAKSATAPSTPPAQAPAAATGKPGSPANVGNKPPPQKPPPRRHSTRFNPLDWLR